MIARANLLLLLGFGLLLSGCTSYQGAAVVPLAWVPATGEAYGQLLGSIGYEGPVWYIRQSLLIRRKGEPETGELRFPAPAVVEERIDFSREGRTGTVFLISLKPGDYEIWDFVLVESSGPYSTRGFRAATSFSIPFRISAGRATYIGEYMVHAIRHRTLLSEGGYFVVRDESTRDLQLVSAAGRRVDASVMSTIVPAPDVLGLPYFRSPER